MPKVVEIDPIILSPQERKEVEECAEGGASMVDLTPLALAIDHLISTFTCAYKDDALTERNTEEDESYAVKMLEDAFNDCPPVFSIAQLDWDRKARGRLSGQTKAG
jgi:hypothetical protein